MSNNIVQFNEEIIKGQIKELYSFLIKTFNYPIASSNAGNNIVG